MTFAPGIGHPVGMFDSAEKGSITLVIFHALLSAGASPSEKTIDEAIKASEILISKLVKVEEKPAKEPSSTSPEQTP